MTVNELNRDEFIELKQKHYSHKNQNVSYDELINVDDLVSDSEILNVYKNIEFVKEDFFCNLDKTRNEKEEKNNIIEEEEYL